jgi:hypothetical protein
MNLAALLAALLLILPCTAAAQEDPETVYGKFHRALMAGNVDEMNKYGTPGGAAEIAKLSPDQRKGVFEMMKKFVPSSYTITARQPGADPRRLTLRATGTIASPFTGKPEPSEGVIQMVKMGNDWKVDESNWNSGKPGAAPPPSAAMRSEPQRLPVPSRSAAPKAPERVMGAAKEPCVYKPVMTNVDMERCR